MTTENTMTSPAVATLSEKELFAEFLQMDIVSRSSMFGEAPATYKPNDSLRDPGLEYQLEEFTNDLADRLARSKQPMNDLESTLEDIENYAHILRRISDDFRWVRLHRIAETDDEEERFEPLQPTKQRAVNHLNLDDPALATSPTLEEIAAGQRPEDAAVLHEINRDMSGQSNAIKMMTGKSAERQPMPLSNIPSHLRKGLGEAL